MTGEAYRLWSRPLVASENVIAVTADALIAVKLPLPQLPRAEAELAAGVVPEGATVVPLADLREVIVGHAEPMVQLLHGPGPTLTEVFFDTKDARDEVLKEMARRLGPAWKLSDRDHTQATTLGIMLLVFAGLTVFLYFATRAAEARTQSGAGFEALADSVGSLGVLAIGGALCLVCLAGAVYSVYYPPKSATLSLRRS